MNADRISKTWTPLLSGTVLFVLLLLTALLTGFDGLYGQDAYAYVDYASQLRAHWLGGAEPGSFFWPEMYPLAGALLSFVLPSVTMAMQVVAMLSAGVALTHFHKIALRLMANQGLDAWVVVLVLGLSPFLWRMALTSMADLPALAAVTVALQQTLKFRDRPAWSPALGMALAASLAVFTRYATFFLIAPLFLEMGRVWLREKQWKWPFGMLPALLAPWLIHLGLSGQGLPAHHFVTEWSLSNWFASSFEMVDGKFDYPLPNLLALGRLLVHPGFLGIGLLGFWLGFRSWRKRIRHLGFTWWGLPLYLLFLAGIPFQNDRFLLLGLPFAAVLVSWPSVWPLRSIPKFMAKGLVAVLFLVQLSLIGYTLRPRIQQNKQEREMAQAVCALSRQRVYTFALDGAVRHHCPQVAVTNLWDAPLVPAEPGDLVLFNPTAFEKQWAGKNPMLNWEYLAAHHNLVPKSQFEGGWTIYEIH